MKIRVCLLAALLVAGWMGATAAASGITPGTYTDAVLIGRVLEDGDWQLNLANDCLKRILSGEEDGRTSQMLQVLTLTDFDLTKVTIKEVTESPGKIRFGFEFNKRMAMKTVYWEANCPIDGFEEDPLHQATAPRMDADQKAAKDVPVLQH